MCVIKKHGALLSHDKHGLTTAYVRCDQNIPSVNTVLNVNSCVEKAHTTQCTSNNILSKTYRVYMKHTWRNCVNSDTVALCGGDYAVRHGDTVRADMPCVTATRCGQTMPCVTATRCGRTMPCVTAALATTSPLVFATSRSYSLPAITDS